MSFRSYSWFGENGYFLNSTAIAGTYNDRFEAVKSLSLELDDRDNTAFAVDLQGCDASHMKGSSLYELGYNRFWNALQELID